MKRSWRLIAQNWTRAAPALPDPLQTMGVPALFRWLSAKYPKIVERVVEAPTIAEDSTELEVNLSDANPNGVEFDNLYLDMNGIIHPCCHPMDKPAPATEEEMIIEIFKYIDRIFAMIRPRRLLFMAIDGVAPRAKMNQQRSRRFRAAKERRGKAQKEAELATNDGDGEEEGGEESGNESSFDYNCITPGTKFMALVSTGIQYYIVERMSRVEAWKGIKVIFSDANVPGEGEHKIVDYIRRQRLDPDYDANTKHVIYGLDADLIMLSMATHEPYFRVLREDVFWEEQVKYSACTFCGVKGHAHEFCPARAEADPSFKMPALGDSKPFIFLDVAVLREYLDAELRPSESLPFKYDLERAIDDWIFMCFFVGNDFLPHLPSLELREGAIDLLIESYKANAAKMGGYICSNGQVNLCRAQFILADLGAVESKIFIKRKEKEDRKEANIKRRQQSDAEREAMTVAQKSLIATTAAHSNEIKTVKEFQSGGENQGIVKQRRDANIAAAQQLKSQMTLMNGSKQSAAEAEESADDVRLWEPGFKERYYLNKFHFEVASKPEELRNICRAYLEGLCWVMGYYYQGCPSWKWFYPYHFAPFASDLLPCITEDPIEFELGEPFRPFDQLMGVFPAASKELVPIPFRALMTETDSEIIDFYPEDFAIDLNGKRQAWQGVVLLPFIEEQRLLTALNKVYPSLSQDDLRMNQRGEDRVFFSREHPAIARLHGALDDDRHSTPLNPMITGGLAGYVKIAVDFPKADEVYPSPLEASLGCHDIVNQQVVAFSYLVPYHERAQLRHKAILLPEAILPTPVLTLEDIANIKSGAASRRVPGRLMLDYPSRSSSERYGHHSMHQEYSNDRRSDRADTRGSYEERERSPGRRGYPSSRHDPPRRYPPSQYPLPPTSQPYAYPPPPPISNNPFDVLTGFDGHRPPPPMQPALSAFHRPPPPGQYQSRQQDMDNLYGGRSGTYGGGDRRRYPPPRN